MNFSAIIDTDKHLMFSLLHLFRHCKNRISARAKSGYPTFSRTEIFAISSASTDRPAETKAARLLGHIGPMSPISPIRGPSLRAGVMAGAYIRDPSVPTESASSRGRGKATLHGNFAHPRRCVRSMRRAVSRYASSTHSTMRVGSGEYSSSMETTPSISNSFIACR